MTADRSAAPWATIARDLYLVAMAVFLVTIVIGILNGADAVEFDRNQLLTHVHSGTVGWLTLTIVASTFLLFRAADRRLMLTLSVLVPVYVVAFYTGNLPFRAIAGTALLAAIAWLLYWAWMAYLASERTLPRLAVALGLTSLGYGAVVGVLIQVGLALELVILPGDTIGAHASAMTFGYLVLCAMGLIEWRILGTRGLPALGVVQVAALFIGGLIISISLLLGIEEAGGGIYLLTQLVAIVIFIIRIGPRAIGTDWAGADPARHFAVASIWAVAALILFMYIVFTFITAADPENALPLQRPHCQRPRGVHRRDHERRAGAAVRTVSARPRAGLGGAGHLLGRQPGPGGVRGGSDRRHVGDQAHRGAGHGGDAAARPGAAGCPNLGLDPGRRPAGGEGRRRGLERSVRAFPRIHG